MVTKTVRNLDPSTRYVFRVRAISQLGVKSGWSEAIDVVTPSDGSVPGAPTDLTVDFETPDLVIGWDPPTQNTDGTVTNDLDKYQVLLDAGVGSVTYETTSTFFVYTFRQNERDFSTPQPGFSIEVRAIDAAGNASDPLLGSANNDPPRTPPDPPSLQSAFSIVSVFMSSHPDDRDVNQFVVQHSDDDVSWSTVGTVTGDTFSHEVDQGSENFYRFRAVDVFNQDSNPSSSASITTSTAPIIDDPPDAPQDLDATVGLTDDGQPFIDLEWTPNQELDLNRYEVQYLATGDPVAQVDVVAPQNSSYRLTDVEEDTEYTIVLYARNHVGQRSDPSNEVTVTTLVDDTPPDTPLDIETIAGIRSITVSWSPNVEFDFSSYELHADQTSGFTPDASNRVFQGNSTFYVLSTEENQTWFFRLRAIDQQGNSSAYTSEFSDTSLQGYVRDLPGTDPNIEPIVEIGSGSQSLTLSGQPEQGLWMGDSVYENAPFAVSYEGSVLARDISITGEYMDSGEYVINTPSFKVTKEGTATADAFVGNEGTIGGVNISPDELHGGTIRGSEFIINAAGQVLFDASGSITWQPGADGGIELAEGGFINNSAYRSDNSTGFHLDESGLILNEGFVSADALQIGVSNANLLRHSAFDIDGLVSGTSLVDDHWEVVAGSADFGLSTQALFFSQSLEATVPSGGVEIGQTVNLNVQLDQDGHLSAAIWARTASGSCDVSLRVDDLDNAESYFSATQSVGSAQWTRISNTWSFLDSTSTVQFVVVAGEGTVRLDGAMLSRTSYAVDWEPAPLEIPPNYISNVHISDLSVDRLTSGTFAGQEIILDDDGSGNDARIANTAGTFEITQEGADFLNGTISIVGGADSVTLDSDSLRVQTGGQTQFYANDSGVFVGGPDATSASFYVDTTDNKVLFQSPDDSGNTFRIDPGVDGTAGRVLRLNPGTGDEADDTFYLTKEGEAFFHKGVIGIDGGSGGFHVNAAGDMWVGNAVKSNAPFVINADGSLDVDMAGGTIEGNFTSGSGGWQIAADGSAEFNDVVIRGELDNSDGPSGISVGENNLRIYEDGAWKAELIPHSSPNGDGMGIETPGGNTFYLTDNSIAMGGKFFVNDDEVSVTNALDVSGKIGGSTNSIRIPRGITGGYGLQEYDSGTGTDWGSSIWALGYSQDGSGEGSNFDPGSSYYGLAWLRQDHPDALFNVYEGLYVYRNGSVIAVLGSASSRFYQDVHVVGDLTVNGSKPAVIQDPDDEMKRYSYCATESDRPGAIEHEVEVQTGQTYQMPEHWGRISNNLRVVSLQPMDSQSGSAWPEIDGWEITIRGQPGRYWMLVRADRCDAGVARWKHVIDDAVEDDRRASLE